MVGGGKDREEMRLIDAEKCPCIVCEDTRNAHCTYEHRSCEKFCNWLNNNAFDTEKAVEEIKKLDLDGVSMVEDGKYTLVRRNEVISLIQTNNACIDELLKGEER